MAFLIGDARILQALAQDRHADVKGVYDSNRMEDVCAPVARIRHTSGFCIARALSPRPRNVRKLHPRVQPLHCLVRVVLDDASPHISLLNCILPWPRVSCFGELLPTAILRDYA